MSDISDLQGVIPTSIRWGAMEGDLSYTSIDLTTGERVRVPIELGSPQARFVLDWHTRERGYADIRVGYYHAVLSAVGAPPPEWPGEPYKPAIGCWLFSPIFGECRLETNQVTFLTPITALWDKVKSTEDIADGMSPVFSFIDRFPLTYPTGTFQGPVLDLLGFYPRDRVPCFARRKITVGVQAAALDDRAFVALPPAPPATSKAPQQPRPSPRPPKTAESLKPDLDRWIDGAGEFDDDVPELG
jgi:hypothetical protein